MHFSLGNLNLSPPPFGMQISERSFTSGIKGYRYGFNGMDRDDEVKGDGNSLDFGARIYDCRLGRFLSRDPLEVNYAWIGPYSFAANNPIAFIDYLGMSIEKPKTEKHTVIQGETPGGVAKSANMSLEVFAMENSRLYKGKDMTYNELWNKKNWSFMVGEEVNVFSKTDANDKISLIKQMPKFNAANPLVSTESILKWINTNELKLFKEGITTIAVKDVISVDDMRKSKMFTHKATALSDQWETNSKPKLWVPNELTSLQTSVTIINHSNIKFEYVYTNGGKKKIVRYGVPGNQPYGFILLGLNGIDPASGNERNVGLQFKFDVSDPEQYDKFRTMNASMGGVTVSFRKNGNNGW